MARSAIIPFTNAQISTKLFNHCLVTASFCLSSFFLYRYSITALSTFSDIYTINKDILLGNIYFTYFLKSRRSSGKTTTSFPQIHKFSSNTKFNHFRKNIMHSNEENLYSNGLFSKFISVKI